MAVGWYLLPDSGFPYFGLIPDDVAEVTEAQALAAYKEFRGGEDDLAELTIDAIEQRVGDAEDLDVIERLIRQEYAGKHRSGAIKALERRRAELEDGDPDK